MESTIPHYAGYTDAVITLCTNGARGMSAVEFTINTSGKIVVVVITGASMDRFAAESREKC